MTDKPEYPSTNGGEYVCKADYDELVAALQLALQGLEVAVNNSPNNGDEAFIGYVFAADKARAVLAKVRP